MLAFAKSPPPALGRIGRDAVPALITALQDDDNDVRRWAAEALGNIGAQARDAVPALTDYGWAREAAANALALIQAPPEAQR